MRRRECLSGVKGWSRASSVGTLRPCTRLVSHFLIFGAERRSKHHLPGNQRYAPADDLSRLKWSVEAKVVILEVAKECRGGTYITVDDLAPHGEELLEFLVNDELFYHAGDLTVPA